MPASNRAKAAMPRPARAAAANTNFKRTPAAILTERPRSFSDLRLRVEPGALRAIPWRRRGDGPPSPRLWRAAFAYSVAGSGLRRKPAAALAQAGGRGGIRTHETLTGLPVFKA